VPTDREALCPCQVGCGFKFEYEHCVDERRKHHNATTQPEDVLLHLNDWCTRSSMRNEQRCAPTTCQSCTSAPCIANGLSFASEQPLAPTDTLAPTTGLQMGPLISGILRLVPAIKIVAHVRTSHHQSHHQLWGR
jgi:hypothetical protein